VEGEGVVKGDCGTDPPRSKALDSFGDEMLKELIEIFIVLWLF
jgi:hypothetical protein